MLPVAAATVMLLVAASPLPSLTMIVWPVRSVELVGNVTAVAAPLSFRTITCDSFTQVTSPAVVLTVVLL